MKTSLGISTLNQNGLKAYFRNIKITQLWKNHTVGTNILFVNKIHVAQAKLLKKKDDDEDYDCTKANAARTAVRSPWAPVCGVYTRVPQRLMTPLATEGWEEPSESEEGVEKSKGEEQEEEEEWFCPDLFSSLKKPIEVSLRF